jgi:hypothetical protein
MEISCPLLKPSPRIKNVYMLAYLADFFSPL